MNLHYFNNPHLYQNLLKCSFSVFFVCIFLTSCTSIQVHSSQLVEVARGVRLQLTSPVVLNQSKALTQSIDIKHADEVHTALAQIEIDADAMALVGMTATGHYLFSIEYHNNSWRYEVSAVVPDHFKPEYLLADFQLSYWPVALLQQHLSGATLRVEKSANQQVQRVIYRGDEKIIEIDYEKDGLWQGRVSFRHLERHYTVVANTLASDNL